MDPSWKEILSSEFDEPYFKRLIEFVKQDRREHVVFPPRGQVFAALDYPFDSVRVCILGQDPYHNRGQAHGLSFSVKKGVAVPPSLINIFKELSSDLGCPTPSHGCLEHWAEQGVLLLNSVLTVRAHEPGSHRDRGWERFTDAVIRALDGRQSPLVFVLWGRYARNKKSVLEGPQHVVIESPHPSPMSASKGFFGSRPFSKANRALRDFGVDPVDWCIPS